MAALINRSTLTEENHKQVLTQLLVQKLLSQEYKKHLASLLSAQRTNDPKTLAFLAKICEGSKEMCVAIVDHEEYMQTLAMNFCELLTKSGSTELEGLEGWLLNVTVFWCILTYHKQDITQL